jgi:hypothetical protein
MEVDEYLESMNEVAEDMIETNDMERLQRLVHTIMAMASRLDLDIEFTGDILKVDDHVPP